MNLYIQIRNGQTFHHPIFEDNFIQAFPDIDINNLPPEFARFRRIPYSECGLTNNDPYKKLDITNYRLADDGFWEDVWGIVEKTQIEIDETNQQYLLKAISMFESRKRRAQEILDSLTDESEKQAWNTYLSMMNSIPTPTAFDMLIPKFPRKDDTGKYIPNLDESGNWTNTVLLTIT